MPNSGHVAKTCLCILVNFVKLTQNIQSSLTSKNYTYIIGKTSIIGFHAPNLKISYRNTVIIIRQLYVFKKVSTFLVDLEISSFLLAMFHDKSFHLQFCLRDCVKGCYKISLESQEAKNQYTFRSPLAVAHKNTASKQQQQQRNCFCLVCFLRQKFFCC